MDAAQNYVQNELTRKYGYEVRFTQGLTSNAQFAMEVACITGDARIAAIATVMYAGLGDEMYDAVEAWERFLEKFTVGSALEGFSVDDFKVVEKKNDTLEKDESYDAEMDA